MGSTRFADRMDARAKARGQDDFRTAVHGQGVCLHPQLRSAKTVIAAVYDHICFMGRSKIQRPRYVSPMGLVSNPFAKYA